MRFWKKSQHEAVRQGNMSKAEYEAKLKAGTPERYFLTLKELKDTKNTLSDDVRKEMK